MTTQAWVIVPTPALCAAIEAIDDPDTGGNVWCRPIDNPLANALGEGVLVGKRVFPARNLTVQVWLDWFNGVGTLQIRTLDADVLFLPPEV